MGESPHCSNASATYVFADSSRLQWCGSGLFQYQPENVQALYACVAQLAHVCQTPSGGVEHTQKRYQTGPAGAGTLEPPE